MSRFRYLLVLLVVGSSWACEKVPLTSPTGSTITLSIDKAAVPIGGTATLTAVVTESSGTAPQNGTMVTFAAPFGTISPQEAATVGGIARATFTGTASGTAKVGAFSGAAKATEVELKVGGAAAERITVRTEPATIPQTGGTVTVIANVQDIGGAALPNTLVNFSVDHGTLSSNAGVTDANGEARITLNTTRASKVTANVGAKTSDFTVAVLAAPTVTVTGCSSTPTVGLAVTCTFTPASPTGGSPIQSVTVNWGDGTPDQNLGSVTGATPASHIFTRPDTYTVTARATDVAGQVGTGSASVVVIRSIPPITITGPSNGTVGVPVTFSVTPPSSSTGVPTSNVTVDFGDGSSRNLGAITATTAVTKVYSSEGTYTVAATVTDTAGGRNTSTTAVSVTRANNPIITFTQTGGTGSGTVPGPPPNKSFAINATAASGFSIRSIVVVLVKNGDTLYNQSGGGTFVTNNAFVGDVLRATATDSAGNTSTFDLVAQ